MLGASRGSLVSARESVDSRRNEPGFDAVSGELFAVADLLSRENTLRVALADSGQPEQARIALANDIFASRVSPLPLDVVRDVVGRRWSTDGDMLTAFEAVASQAAFTVAEADGTLGRVEEELFTFGSSIDSSPELQMTLTDPALSSTTKSAVVHSLLDGRAAPATIQVLTYMAGHLRGRRADTATEDLSNLAAAQRGRLVAEVVSAIELDEAQEQELTDALSRLQGRAVQLNVAVDPRVLGGISVRIGDEVIDGTVASRLEQARRAVAG